jgi:hypothetical protein
LSTFDDPSAAEAQLDTIRRLEAAYRAGDRIALTELWDEFEPVPVYIAEDCDPLIGWEPIDRYLHARFLALSRIELSTSKHRLRQIDEWLALAWFDLDWAAAASYGRTGGTLQVSAVLRNTAAGWRFVHWVEAPLAPLPHAIQLYERAAGRPDEVAW